MFYIFSFVRLNTKLKIAFHTNNTIQNLLKNKVQISDKYAALGVYKLTCPDCKKAYVGQTGRSFSTRFNEHKLAFRNNSHTSKFTQHLIEHTHSFGTIHDTVQILHNHKKSAHLKTLERYHINAEYANNNHLNDSHTIVPNAIFDTLLKNPLSINTPPPTTIPQTVTPPNTLTLAPCYTPATKPVLRSSRTHAQEPRTQFHQQILDTITTNCT